MAEAARSGDAPPARAAGASAPQNQPTPATATGHGTICRQIDG